MAGMVDLKKSPEQVKKTMTAAEPSDYYPLTLYLDKEMVEKLGLTNCKVGDDYPMQAVVHVGSMSKSENERGVGHSSITLEVRKAQIGEGKSSASEQADKLYNKA